MRAIVIMISDHISDEEANEFAQDINDRFQPHENAYLAEVSARPKPAWMAADRN